MGLLISKIKNSLRNISCGNFRCGKYLFVIIILLAGYAIYLRCVNTFSGNTIGLWYDEGFVSSMISANIFKTIMHLGLVRPILYLLITKGSIFICGNNEYAFRLPSIIFSILSIALFLHLVRSIISDRLVQLVVVFLFLFNPYIINQSGEAKAYSYEILLYLVVFVCLLRYMKSNRQSYLILLMSISILTPILSNTLVFILPSVYIVIIYNLLKKSSLKSVIIVVCCAMINIIMILGFYIILSGSKAQGGINSVQWYYSGGYFPSDTDSIVLFYLNSFSTMIDFFTSCPVFIPQGAIIKNILSVAYTILFITTSIEKCN